MLYFTREAHGYALAHPRHFTATAAPMSIMIGDAYVQAVGGVLQGRQCAHAASKQPRWSRPPLAFCDRGTRTGAASLRLNRQGLGRCQRSRTLV